MTNANENVLIVQYDANNERIEESVTKLAFTDSYDEYLQFAGKVNGIDTEVRIPYGLLERLFKRAIQYASNNSDIDIDYSY